MRNAARVSALMLAIALLVVLPQQVRVPLSFPPRHVPSPFDCTCRPAKSIFMPILHLRFPGGADQGAMVRDPDRRALPRPEG